MKKIAFVIIMTLLCSCSAMYVGGEYCQVATAASDNTEQLDDGSFYAMEHGVIVTYNLWAENGCSGVLITNTNDFDVFLDADRSFFIKNGIAYTYHNALSDNNILTIPANLSVYINEFPITDTGYRYCGLSRSPRGDDEYTKSFSLGNTPLTFGNRLMFIVEGEDVQMQNDFYIQQLLNTDINNAIVSGYRKICGEKELYEENRYEGPDRFFIILRYLESFNTSSDTRE